jgi:hypothetical protein
VSLVLNFHSRNAKDLTVLAMRSFAARNYLVDAKVISTLD